MSKRQAPDAGSKRLVDEPLALEHGLTATEYMKIRQHLGRTPTIEELGVFSVMWSEHCSYKSSRAHLGKLPTTGPRVLQGPGENAGGIDIGGGMAAIFKIESHNHPSYIEPYQGAATGVGGILRDIFTMGARPVANMNSLRFGAADHERTPYLLGGVVAGIGGYGNSVGVATVGGEVHFDAAYNGNILVNAFTLGVVKSEEIFRARASGQGNPVFYVGSKTGRDGIHGASLLASSEFKEESEQMKPTVQVGDPFTENILIEALLEAMRTGDLVAVQDMGAAGLTSSTVEMASRGEVGITLDLDRVPLRDATLTPYEMLLSESQERMVLVVKKGGEAKVEAIFARWGLDCIAIGTVTDDNKFRTLYRGEAVVEIPVNALTDDAPVYDRPVAEPRRERDPQRYGRSIDYAKLPIPSDWNRELLEMIASPNLCSRRWVWEQYDSFVGANTIVQPGSDAAVVRVRETGGALAITTDCNSRYCALDPYVGTQHAVAETVRNLACTGARAAALSDCLNFGSPEKPEIMWEFVRSIEGMANACEAFGTPVISGNVSFYNETLGSSIPPTPVVAMLGIVKDAERVARTGFDADENLIAVLGAGEPELAPSEYLASRHGLRGESPPRIDLEAERRLAEACVTMIERGLVASAHDVSDGGLAVALTEMALEGGRGCRVTVGDEGMRPDTVLFGESGCRIILCFAPSAAAGVGEIAAAAGLPLRTIGEAGGSRVAITVTGTAPESVRIDLDLEALRARRETTLPAIASGAYRTKSAA